MRLNVYENGKLIGQEYQRDDGKWMHKWIDKDGVFERGSWRGRCDWDNTKKWQYKKIQE